MIIPLKATKADTRESNSPRCTISVSIGPYNFLFFGLILAPLRSLFVYKHPQGRTECQEIIRERKEERMRPKKGELHELLYTEIERIT